jgi:hypothetical protein
MKQIIKDVLNDMSNSQVNLASEAARETVSSLISAALKTKGSYIEFTDSEIEEYRASKSWVCSICGENTFEVDYDYIGSGTNHLGCELKSQEDIDEYIEDIDEQAYAQGRGSSHRVVDDAGVDIETGKYVGGGSEEIDGAYTAEEFEEWEEAVKKEPELKFDTITEELYTDEPHEELPFREKNWLQQKHEDKVFGKPGKWREDIKTGHDQGGNYEIPEGLKRAKELSQEAIKEGIQKQAYLEMTSDGLPEGGDAQAVLESHKLAEEIVEAQEGTWIYESPDGGKTVFRRPFSDYDPKNKEEIDFKTKEPTGRKFTDYPFKKIENIQIDGC